MIGKKVKVIRNAVSTTKSYCHGETGVVIEEGPTVDKVLVKMDNTHLTEVPYVFLKDELQVI